MEYHKNGGVRLKTIENGTITSVAGFKAAAVNCRIKDNDKNDLGLIVGEKKNICVGVFTQNMVRSKTIDLSIKNIENNNIKAIIVNSGNANACVGQKGYNDALKMTELIADELNIKKEEVVVASTGVIGQELPMEKIEKGIKEISKHLKKDGGEEVAKAIMTTDLVPKNIAVDIKLENGKIVRIAGIAKGSGMIHPNMATMLGFITTDMNIKKEVLQDLLREITNKTFNMISVDRDTSTNDMVIVLANGMAENEEVKDENSLDYEEFKKGLYYVMEYLAKSIARDGEGATKLIEVQVDNASSFDDAKKVGKSVINSPLVKTAIYGEDANWGRIIAAVGYSGATVSEAEIDIFVGDIQVCKNGIGVLESEEEVNKILKTDEIKIKIDLKLGVERAKVWGCDLTYDYIKINADYRS
ncbi:MAG: bifunctional ornithine acetyltransferase/N-acetylglutamate synthase [Fusobacteriia bacterium 4572_132]|nr:MAG: bifunctional ornithine acetyltransferase/N-acetylglutamate synthase [Fusobacteriia bacterium 4572_132]